MGLFPSLLATQVGAIWPEIYFLFARQVLARILDPNRTGDDAAAVAAPEAKRDCVLVRLARPRLGCAWRLRRRGPEESPTLILRWRPVECVPMDITS